MYPNLRLELSSKNDELTGGPHVQTETVHNLDLASGDRHLVSHSLVKAAKFGCGIE